MRGVIPALVTPVDARERLNKDALRRLVNHVIAGGVHGVFATGSQGEFWAFSAEEKRRVWEVTVEAAKGRVPVYAGTAAISTHEAIALTQSAEKVGVDAVSILTPYFTIPNQQELYEHYAAIAAETSLPILLYTNPARTGVSLQPGTVTRLAEIPNIVGIKDSSGDLSLTADYIRVTAQAESEDPFCVLMGRDTLIYAALLHGAQGAIAATGNVVPALVASIYDRFLAGDLAGARRAQEELAPLRHAFGWGSFPVVIKAALNMMGLQAGPARRPVGPMDPEKRADLQGVLRELGCLEE
jgi:4-hydroxy-tetrahydrodipicolinate synthase